MMTAESWILTLALLPPWTVGHPLSPSGVQPFQAIDLGPYRTKGECEATLTKLKVLIPKGQKIAWETCAHPRPDYGKPAPPALKGKP